VEARDRLSRVYGDETWRVYDALDESLSPRGPDALYELAGSFLTAGSTVLDAGCRDATHLIALVERFDVTGVGIDAVEVHVERARAAVDAAGAADRIEVQAGVLEELPFPDARFDFVWCRDVLEQVDDLDRALAESLRVLRDGGRMLVYTTFATDRLTLQDATLLDRHLGNVAENLDRTRVETAFARAGFTVERTNEIGTEWREHVEERDGTVSRALLRLSRLRRQREVLIERFGSDVYHHVEANLHWEVFQFLGKLAPVVHVLARPGGDDRMRYSRAMHPDDLHLLEGVGSETKVASGRVLIEPGQLGSGLYVILEGTVLVEAPEGTHELGAGTVVGERALLSEDGRRTARVRATSDVRVLAVDRVDIERLCADNADFARRLADF